MLGEHCGAPDITKAQEIRTSRRNLRIAPVSLRRRYRLNTNSIDAVALLRNSGAVPST
jgi:hypothetical protein